MNITSHPKPTTFSAGSIVRYTPSDGRSDRIGIVTSVAIIAGKPRVHISEIEHRGIHAMQTGSSISAPATSVERVEIDVDIDPFIVSQMAPRKVA